MATFKLIYSENSSESFVKDDECNGIYTTSIRSNFEKFKDDVKEEGGKVVRDEQTLFEVELPDD